MNDSKKSQSGNPLFDPLVECFGRAGLTGLASFWFGKSAFLILANYFYRILSANDSKPNKCFLFSVFNITFSAKAS